MLFGIFNTCVIHVGQKTGYQPELKCSKRTGHKFIQCQNTWVCKPCNQTGHNQSECSNSSLNTSRVSDDGDVAEVDDDNHNDDHNDDHHETDPMASDGESGDEQEKHSNLSQRPDHLSETSPVGVPA